MRGRFGAGRAAGLDNALLLDEGLPNLRKVLRRLELLHTTFMNAHVAGQ